VCTKLGVARVSVGGRPKAGGGARGEQVHAVQWSRPDIYGRKHRRVTRQHQQHRAPCRDDGTSGMLVVGSRIEIVAITRRGAGGGRRRAEEGKEEGGGKRGRRRGFWRRLLWRRSKPVWRCREPGDCRRRWMACRRAKEREAGAGGDATAPRTAGNQNSGPGRAEQMQESQ
jgi:hypothetical protein